MSIPFPLESCFEKKLAYPREHGSGKEHYDVPQGAGVLSRLEDVGG